MNSNSQIKLGALLSYFSIAVNIIAGLFYTPWMINSIGLENFGLYTLAMSVIGLFLFDFGLSSAVTRFITKYLAESREYKANQCLGLVYRLYFGIDVFLFLVLTVVFFFIPQIYQELTPDEIGRFKIVYVIAAFYSVLSFPFIPVNGVLIAHEKFVQLKLCDVVHKVIMVGTMSVCLMLGYGLYALVLVNVFAGVVMIVLKLCCVRYFTPQVINWGYWNKTELKEITCYSGWITIASLAQRCIFNIAPSILGVLSGSTAIAILGIAITLEGYTYTFANALNGLFLPKVSRIVAGDGNLLPLMIKVGRIQILITSLIIWGFVCLGKDFISLWVGENFNTSYLCAVLIILPSLLQLPQEIGMQAIIAQNKVKQQAFVYLGMAILNLLGAVLLTPKYGAVGLCSSIFVAYLFRTIGLDYILCKQLRIDIWKFFIESYGKMTPALLVSLILGFFISWFISIDGIWGFICDCIVFIITYSIVMWSFAMNENEKGIFIGVFNRLTRA
jgi:O-antigen/teichoic acid export membrane protein